MKYFYKLFIGFIGIIMMSCNNPQPAVKIELSPLFTDHMVLQREMEIPVWGNADANGTVQVEFNGQKIKTVANDSGEWQAILKPEKAGGPYQMKTSGVDTLVINDILIGEVWLASGQSNMEMPLAGWGQILNFEQEIANADYPNIRLFQVERTMDIEPSKKVNSAGWKVCSPENIPDFSATAYFFGRKLHKDLNVPIGLVHSSWGGTIIETWMSEKSLIQFPEFQNPLNKLNNIRAQIESLKSAESDENIFETFEKQWRVEIEAKDRGFNSDGPSWNKTDIDLTDWKKMNLPEVWENEGLPGLDGIVWFRKEVDLPTSWVGTEIKLHLSAVDDIDSTYFNGELIGSSDIWNTERVYSVPAELVKSGKNIVTVRVQDNQGAGGIWGEPDLLKLAFGKKTISLTGEWRYKIGLDWNELDTPGLRPNQPNYPTILSNSMIEPLVPFAIKGAIWYQGESNADRAMQYRKLFPALIRDWRKRWAQGDFPFIFAQLANYMERKAEPADDSWAELREAQLMTLSVENTGMAVTIDIGDAEDIHPKNKQEVGRRLALNALKIVYQQEVNYSGPIYRGMKIEGDRIRMAFEHIADGLKTSDKKSLRGFAIAGQDKKFVWANAKIENEEIIVWHPKVKNPAAVRYSWEANPEGNLINSAGLPASPFRTDDWQGITAEK